MARTRSAISTTLVSLRVQGVDRIEGLDAYTRRDDRDLARALHTAIADLLSGDNDWPGPGVITARLRAAKDGPIRKRITTEDLRRCINQCWREPVSDVELLDGDFTISWQSDDPPLNDSRGGAKLAPQDRIPHPGPFQQLVDGSPEDVVPKKVPKKNSGDARTRAVAGSVVRNEFAAASLGDLVAAFVPNVPTGAIRRLEEIIREAQVDPPGDRAAFVRDVKLLLDVLSLRIQTDDGDLGGLVLDSKGQIGITRRGRGGNRGFKNTTIRLVSVPRIHAGNRYTGSSHPEP
ncbi:MAG: hypothetical protein AB7G17_07230 [Phycisphaerales bacterium]